MAQPKPNNSVLHEWVMQLSLKEQGTVLAAIRGCDVTPREPDDAIETSLTRFMRWLIMIPADPSQVDTVGAFMQSKVPNSWKASDLDPFPLHWYLHVMEAYEVVAYHNPDGDLADRALAIYTEMVMHLNLTLETREAMIKRLADD